MKQKNNIENLYGMVIAPAKSCNICISGGNCRKIDVPGIGLLCLMKESDAFRDLQSKYEALQEDSAVMSVELSELRSKCGHLEKMATDAEKARKDEYELRLEYQSRNDTLELSNGHMEAELNRVREANKSLSELNDERLVQIKNLRSRGFLARVFKELRRDVTKAFSFSRRPSSRQGKSLLTASTALSPCQYLQSFS